MALFGSQSTSPISSVQSLRSPAIPRPFVSKPLVSRIPICIFSRISISASPNFLNPNSTLYRFQCCTNSSSSSSSSIKPDEPPQNVIFIKGLPLSTSEGTLRSAFSQFGKVSRVKIIIDKKNKQPLGFAYVWFSSEESAQMAVKEMNGKFLDGRFVYVTIARPGSWKTPARAKAKPYKF